MLVCLFTLPALAAPSGSCPSSALGAFQVASNVAASFSNSGSTTTYTFFSLKDESPINNGVPGLVKYCVYPTPAAQPANITVEATDPDGDLWISGKDASDFMFGRPGGNKTNIPLDGKTTTMGTATWSSDAPTAQTILLHIADSDVCASLYGGTSPTCFVKPNPALACDQGDTTVAYNAMPFGVVNCSKPSWGFEARSTSEFGDEVQLAGTATGLDSLKVLFASYACQQGHWNDGTCVTTPGPGDTFTHSITGNIYSVKTTGCPAGVTPPCPDQLLAFDTETFTIPYRPSAAGTTICPDSSSDFVAGSQWFNPPANGGAGGCQSSISTVLTFTFPTGTVPIDRNVIWTVAFNTTDYGNPKIGTTACNSTSGGCLYDSLNVGIKTFPGAPYAGTDVDPDGFFFSSTWANAGCAAGATGVLRLDTGCWSGFTPLGEITTK